MPSSAGWRGAAPARSRAEYRHGDGAAATLLVLLRLDGGGVEKIRAVSTACEILERLAETSDDADLRHHVAFGLHVSREPESVGTVEPLAQQAEFRAAPHEWGQSPLKSTCPGSANSGRPLAR